MGSALSSHHLFETTRPRLFALVNTVKSRDYTPVATTTFLQTTPLRPVDRLVVISNDDPEIGPMLGADKRIELVHNPQPRGFAENVNTMIDEALRTGSDLFFMNNDVVFFDNWLEPLLGRDDVILSPLSNREVQYGGSVVVVKTQKMAQTTIFTAPMELADYQKSPRMFAAIAEAHRSFPRGLMPVIVFPFFCVRLPLPILQRLGKFDVRFGRAGGEDYDYCLRAWLAGYQVAFEIGSLLLHFWGKSTTQNGKEPSYDQTFLEVFREKWGKRLFSVILEEQVRPIEDDPIARGCRDRGDFAGMVQALLERENELYIP